MRILWATRISTGAKLQGLCAHPTKTAAEFAAELATAHGIAAADIAVQVEVTATDARYAEVQSDLVATGIAPLPKVLTQKEQDRQTALTALTTAKGDIANSASAKAAFDALTKVI